MTFDDWWREQRLEDQHGKDARLASMMAWDAATKLEREACAVQAWMTGMDYHTKKLGLPVDARECGSACAERIRARAALAQQPAAIPRLPNCGRYTATDNNGQHYYLNHANTWQTFQGQQPAADAYCMTTGDGECVSIDSRCMHQPGGSDNGR